MFANFDNKEHWAAFLGFELRHCEILSTLVLE